MQSQVPQPELRYCSSDQAIAPVFRNSVSRNPKTLAPPPKVGGTRGSNPVLASMNGGDLLVVNTNRSKGRSRMPSSKNSVTCSLTLSQLGLSSTESPVDQFGVSDLTMDSGLMSMRRSSDLMSLDERPESEMACSRPRMGWKPSLAFPLASRAFPGLTSDCRDVTPPRKPGRKDSASSQSLAEAVSSVFKLVPRPDIIPKFPSRGSSSASSQFS